jgi:hypothetical protein
MSFLPCFVEQEIKNTKSVKMYSFIVVSLKLLPTFPCYNGFGTKLALFFGLTKFSQIQTILKLSQLPKSIVASVMRRSFNFLVIYRILQNFLSLNFDTFQYMNLKNRFVLKIALGL